MSNKTEPSLFVIFGGTGDLSRRKLLPALARNEAEGHLNDRFRVIAVGRSPKDDEVFRNTAREALEKAGAHVASMPHEVPAIVKKHTAKWEQSLGGEAIKKVAKDIRVQKG